MTDPFPGLPRNHFGAMLADPPWSFRTYSGEKAVPTLAADPYPTMTLAEMKLLPVADLALPDALLVMWIVSSHLVEALELGSSWGFTYRSIGPVWAKDRAPTQAEMFDDGPICDLGMGYWFRQQVEIALVFGRGSPKRLARNVRQYVGSPRREHSRKPDCVHERIERLVAGPRLELFARSPRKGWTVWGNQTDKFST